MDLRSIPTFKKMRGFHARYINQNMLISADPCRCHDDDVIPDIPKNEQKTIMNQTVIQTDSIYNMHKWSQMITMHFNAHVKPLGPQEIPWPRHSWSFASARSTGIFRLKIFYEHRRHDDYEIISSLWLWLYNIISYYDDDDDYPLVICYIANWKITMLLMGKSTISMVIFNSELLVYQRV